MSEKESNRGRERKEGEIDRNRERGERMEGEDESPPSRITRACRACGRARVRDCGRDGRWERGKMIRRKDYEREGERLGERIS